MCMCIFLFFVSALFEPANKKCFSGCIPELGDRRGKKGGGRANVETVRSTRSEFPGAFPRERRGEKKIAKKKK